MREVNLFLIHLSGYQENFIVENNEEAQRMGAPAQVSQTVTFPLNNAGNPLWDLSGKGYSGNNGYQSFENGVCSRSMHVRKGGDKNFCRFTQTINAADSAWLDGFKDVMGGVSRTRLLTVNININKLKST